MPVCDKCNYESKGFNGFKTRIMERIVGIFYVELRKLKKNGVKNINGALDDYVDDMDNIADAIIEREENKD